jgi:hypothetical protein
LNNLRQRRAALAKITWPLIARLAAFAFFLTLGAHLSAADSPISNRNVLRFGAAQKGAPTDDRAIVFSNELAYANDVGYGWTHPPVLAFARPEPSRSPSNLVRHGVAGRRLGFRADVRAGAWVVILWLDEVGVERFSPTLAVNGERRSLAWRNLNAEQEPGHEDRKIYRVFEETAHVDSRGLSFELADQRHDVRLLGFTLIRQAPPSTAEHEAILAKLKSAGAYSSSEFLAPLVARIDELVRRNPDDAFAVYWRNRVTRLEVAEKLFAMRGWQSADQQTGLGMFDRLNQSLVLLDSLLSTAGDDPLAERARFLRSRLLYWLDKQHEGNEIANGRGDLELLYRRHPHDPLLAMYCGELIDTPDPCDSCSAAPTAPAWSQAQFEALCRLRSIAHWWASRQGATGEFGGKFNDDVELLRWWSPLTLSGDLKARQAWQRLADGVWQSDQILNGYSRKLRDVEHAAELVADTAPLMVLHSDDPRYERRLEHSTDLFEKLWTGRSEQGHRFFRSAWFNSTAIAEGEPRNRDVEYNARAVRAIRYLAWKQPAAERERRLLHEWSTAWAVAAKGTDKGKPAGIVPPSIRFPDEAINGDETSWHEANMYWDYYDWAAHAGSLMLDQMLFTFTLTGDENLLEPIHAALELVDAEAPSTTGEPLAATPGSRAWAAQRLVESPMFWRVVEQWRFLRRDARWDHLIMRHGTDYSRYRLTRDEQHLVRGLDRLLAAVRYNTPLLTSEAIHTDRVYAPGWEHLKAMLTGDGMPENSSPYFAVSWENTDAGFTGLVRDVRRERLEVEIFSHSSHDRAITMRLWQLPSGEYVLLQKIPGAAFDRRTIIVEGKGQRISIHLPAGKLVEIIVSRDETTAAGH